MTAPEQADLRQRIARVVPYCRDGCDFCEPDTVATAVLAVVEPVLARRQDRGDIWKVKAQEMEQDRDRLAVELAALREQLAAAQAETARLRARLDDYGSPILGPVPVPPPDLGSIRMAEARNELERTGTTDKPWAAGRGLCPEKTGCPSGLLALFQLTKRGRLPVHSGEYGGPCDGSGKKPSVVLRYTAARPSV